MNRPQAAYPTPPQGAPFGHFDQKYDGASHGGHAVHSYADGTKISSKYSDGSMHSQTPPATPILTSPGRLSACRDEFPSNNLPGSFNPLIHNQAQELFPPMHGLSPQTQLPSLNLFPSAQQPQKPVLPDFKTFCEEAEVEPYYVSSADTKWREPLPFAPGVRHSPREMFQEEYSEHYLEPLPLQTPRQFYSRQQILRNRDTRLIATPTPPPPANLMFAASPRTPPVGRPRHRKTNSDPSKDEAPKKRRRVAPRPLDENGEPKKRVADDDFSAIEDFAPSMDKLSPTQLAALRTTWTESSPLDLSNDPNIHLLHPAEKRLASVLRLSCARYLTCKRRIFQASHERHITGKKFNKTDAQQACKIDVNKASRLWQAFSDAGLFE